MATKMYLLNISKIFYSTIMALLLLWHNPLCGAENDSLHVSPDSVELLGNKYAVPPPWRGHLIGDNQSSQPENLVMLPREYGYDSSRIYVTSETKRAFLEMIRAAEKDGIFFKARSGYRGFWYQKKKRHLFDFQLI